MQSAPRARRTPGARKKTPMKIQNITPVVTTSDLKAARDFYVRHFGFQVSFDHEHYLGLRAGAPGSPELGFMAPDEMAPGTFQGSGMSFSFRVEDVDAAHAQLVKSGAPIVQAPADQPWGARMMITRDPFGVLLFVSHPIPIAPELASSLR